MKMKGNCHAKCVTRCRKNYNRGAKMKIIEKFHFIDINLPFYKILYKILRIF